MKEKNKNNRRKLKYIVGFLVFFIAVQICGSIVMYPKAAKAVMLGPVPEPVVEVGPQLKLSIWQKAWNSIQKAIKTAGDVTFQNTLKRYLNNIAYDAAVKLATGDWGQKPMFPTKPGDLLEQAADVAAGDFLDSMARGVVGTKYCNSNSTQSCQKDSECAGPRMLCPTEAINSDMTKYVTSEEAASDQGLDWGLSAQDTLSTYCAASRENYDKCLAMGCMVVEGVSDIYGKEAPEGYFYMAGYGVCESNFSLCQENPLIKMNITLAAKNIVFGKGAMITGKCPLSSIIKNFEQGVTDWDPNLTNRQKTQLYLAEISKTFNPNASDIGAVMETSIKAEKTGAIAKEKKSFAQSLSGEFTPVVSKITKAVKTPGTLIENTMTSIMGESLSKKYTGTPIADAIGVFTNTLASKLLNKYFSGVISEEQASRGAGGGGTGALSGLMGGTSSGITAAKITYAELQKTDYAVGGEMDVLSLLASCTDVNNSTPDNCVIDNRFSTAIQQKMTVQEALNQGLLDGAKTFGYDKQGREPSYVNGYPYRSLVILRKYRVIPVGWELAAEYIKTYAPGNYSLNSLIADYSNPNSPFYRLVDPNWVLKIPQVYCARQGAGPKIQNEQAVRTEDTNGDGNIDAKDAAIMTVQRQDDYCVDEQMCLLENSDGSCKRYGYCIEEKPVWQFEGTSCQKEFNTCQTFTKSNKEQISYLKNTLNYDNCSASNAGCQWYCQDWDQTNKRWTCVNDPPTAGNLKVSLNKNAALCKADAEGCTEMVSLKPNNGFNLIRNGGFEYLGEGAVVDDGLNDEIMDWSIGDTAITTYEYVSDAFSGATALHLVGTQPGNNWVATGFDTGHSIVGRTFTWSFYGKNKNAGGACVTEMHLETDYIDSGTGNKGYHYFPAENISFTDEWQRFSQTITLRDFIEIDSIGAAHTGREAFNVIPTFRATTGCDIIVDNAQLEENSAATDYKSFESNPKIYLRQPPDYLGCTGNANTDNPECRNYALVCTAGEVGCNAYTSTSTGQTITGTITSQTACLNNIPSSCDQCPAEFVGCRAYRELPIERMPRRPVRDPVSFVASTGRDCSASAVGCEEYTNLEAVAAGGEGKEYYSRIKMCVELNDTDTAPYYTWEGSDEFGYQLKKYTLKKSNAGNQPCTNMMPESTALGANSWPNCVDGETFDENGDGVDETHPSALCAAADVGVNPDCAEFYDTAGITYYVLRSKVIYQSDNCKSFRNTFDGPDLTYHLIPGQGAVCSANQAGCRAYKGNAGDNTRTIYYERFENGTASPWDGVYSNESLNVGGHSMAVFNLASAPLKEPLPPNLINFSFQDEHSYTVSFWAKGAVADVPISAFIDNNIPADGPSLIFSGQAVARAGEWNLFTVGPLYLPANTVALPGQRFGLAGSSAFYVDNIAVSEVTENIYKIKDSYKECSGYENCDEYADRGGMINYLKSFTSLCGADKVGCEAMVDTRNTASPFAEPYVIAKRGDANRDGAVDWEDAGYLGNLIKNLQEVPPLAVLPPPFTMTIIDLNSDGDINGADLTILLDYLNGKATLDPANIYTSDTTSPYVPLPEDRTVTLVNDPAKTCTAAGKGCERLGKPTLDASGAVTKFTDVYMTNNPDKYGETMCLWEDNGCGEYAVANGAAKMYFKNPGDNACEYKKITGQNTSGWYKLNSTSAAPDCPVPKGICDAGTFTGRPCNDTTDCGMEMCAVGVCEDGANKDLACEDDADCAGSRCLPTYNLTKQPIDNWAGLCPEKESGCGEYRDPENPAKCDVYLAAGAGDGKSTFACDSYYQIASTVDLKTCNGLVSRAEGCRLFYDVQGRTRYPFQTSFNLPYDSGKSADGQPPTLCGKICNAGDNNGKSCNLDTDCPNAPAGACVIDSQNCDADTIIKVRRDRQCNKWLECETSLLTEQKDTGKTDQLCTARYICDQLDEQTGYCTHFVNFQNANQTFTTPAFADQVSNYSGMVLFGLDWGRRCENDFNKICSCPKACWGGANNGNSCDLGCPGGNCLEAPGNCDEDPINKKCDLGVKCSAPQVIEGYRPVPGMKEEGSIGITGDLVANGDFGDGDYELNQTLSKHLSSATDAATTLNAGEDDFIDGWSVKGNAGLSWTEENKNNGLVPSENSNLDENNILWIHANGDLTGASYALRNINADDNYAVSLKLRFGTAPSASDKVLVQIKYNTAGGDKYQWVDAPVKATEKWQTFALGPFTAGYENNGTGVNQTKLTINQAALEIVQYKEGGGSASAMDIYVDDVSMKPVLAAQYGACAEDTNSPAYSWKGKVCMTRQDCATTAFPLAYCDQSANFARSCRLYPNAEAPYCTYTDSNSITYRGWYGYCLEKDPGNANYCLNWWPVDLLLGETDVFGQMREMSTNIRKPLYMCMVAKGNYSPFIDAKTGTKYYNTTDVFTVKDNGTNSVDWDTCSGGNATTMTISATSITEEDMNRAEFNWLSVDEEHWKNYSGYFTQEMVRGGFNCDINTEPLICDAKSKIERVINSDGDIVWRLKPIVTCTPGSDDFPGLGYQCLGLCIKFDGTTHNLKEVKTIGVDSTGEAWEKGTYQLRLHVKESCTKLAQVVSSDSSDVPKAWMARLQSASPYTVPDLEYGYKVDYKPYGGAINPENNDDPTPWPLLCVEQRTNPPTATDQPARAGSPYSCNGYDCAINPSSCGGSDCTKRVCSWDVNNDCSNDSKINTCIAHQVNGVDGYCIGLGDGFCEKDMTKRCSLDTDCGGGECLIGIAGTWASGRSDATAAGRLERLFADVNSVWSWKNGSYINAGMGWHASYLNMSQCVNNTTRPIYPNDYCGMLATVGTKAIFNGQTYSDGDTIDLGVIGNNKKVRFDFTIKANEEQEPIRRLDIDWGDGSGIKEFTGTYDSGTISMERDYINLSSGSTVTPMIRVVDNWDWCAIKEGDDPTVGDHRYDYWNDDKCDFASTGITITAPP